MRDIAYLKLLAREYPTIQSASTEIRLPYRDFQREQNIFSVTCMENMRRLSICFEALPVLSGKRSRRPLVT